MFFDEKQKLKRNRPQSVSNEFLFDLNFQKLSWQFMGNREERELFFTVF